MSDHYPILVKDYTGDQSMTIVCESCDAEAVIGPDDIHNDGSYSCPAGCEASAVYKYEVADTCRNCGKLGFFDHAGGCCSRACRLQVGYSEQLRSVP